MISILGYGFGNTYDPAMRVAGLIRRLAEHEGVEGHVLANQMPADRRATAGISWYECPIDKANIMSKLRELILRVNPMLFIVDGYPMGIRGDLERLLPEFHCPAVLVQRYLPAKYYYEKNLPDFTREYYQATIAPSDVLPYVPLGRSIHTDPIPCYDHDKVLDPVDAKIELHYSGRPIYVVSDAMPDGVRLFKTLLKRCPTVKGLRIDWRLHTNDPLVLREYEEVAITSLSLGSVAEALSGMILPAGYAMYYDAVQSGVPTIFMAQNDPDDDQEKRVGSDVMTDATQLLKRIQEGDFPEQVPAKSYTGGKVASEFLRQIICYRTPLYSTLTPFQVRLPMRGLVKVSPKIKVTGTQEVKRPVIEAAQ
jgi:hypothetical protein